VTRATSQREICDWLFKDDCVKQVISIEKIETHDHLFYKVTRKSANQHAIKNLDRERIKGKRFRASFAQLGLH
jgi:hypothetical protein